MPSRSIDEKKALSDGVGLAVPGAMREPSLLDALGPGILFAAASVGVSHLVQATRAGAAYGLGMILIILVAHAMKYSAFRSGSMYARATGKSLIHAYRLQGRWPLALFGIITLSSMSITLAGVTIVAAGLCQATIVSGLSLSTTSLLLLMLAASILLRGKYHYLERAAKVLVVLLSLITVATTLLALPGINWSDSGHLMPESWDIKTILFAIALVGWMPTTLDASIWQSLWTVEKVQESGKNISAKNRSLDFHIGFVGTGVLAICFCLIGASIMHGNGITFSNTAAGFSAQLIDMYAKTLGEWSRPVIGFSALAVMFSTVLTVVDGYPRALSSLIAIIKAPKDARTVENDNGPAADNTYSYIVVFQVLAAYILISYWAHSFTGLIDIAASIAFMSAPFIAFFNHRAMRSNAISPQYRLSGPHYVASLVSICLLSAFALICIYYMTI